MSASATRILVVDDEPPIRRLLRTGLASQGYDVLEAGTGHEAEQQLASAPELVILDLGLPDVTGQDLLRRWRAGGNDVPVLILSNRSPRPQCFEGDGALLPQWSIRLPRRVSLTDCSSPRATVDSTAKRNASSKPDFDVPAKL